jgi:hypothetical protein
MPIRVRCPNTACSKLLSVPDKLAGKGCRCPGCKTEIHVPAPEASADDIVEDVAVVDDTAYSEKPQPVRQAVAGPAPRRRAEEDEDEDSNEEDYDDEDRPKGKRKKAPVVKSPTSPLSLILFGVGLLLLISAACMVFLPWISVTTEVEAKGKKVSGTMLLSGMGNASMSGTDLNDNKVERTATVPPENRPHGLVFLIVGAAMSLVILIGFGIAASGLLDQGISWRTAGIVALIGECISILLLCWQLAWIWKIITLSELVRKDAERTQIGPFAATITTSTNPGLGLFIGMGCAVFAAYAFSNLAGHFNRRVWGYVADLSGVALGGLVLWLVVRPWNADALFQGIRGL